MNKLVDWNTIAGSDMSRPGTVSSWYGFEQGGWASYRDRAMEPEIAKGVTRFVQHNPFGFPAWKTFMQVDQAILAREGGRDYMFDQFYPVFEGLVRRGIEPINYYGTLVGTDRLTPLGKRAWLEYAIRCVRESMDTGCSIAFDGGATYPDGSMAARFCQWLQGAGIKVYLEGRPVKGNDWVLAFPLIITATYYDRSDPAKFPDYANFHPNADLLRWPEVIVQTDTPGIGIAYDYATWLKNNWVGPESRQIISRGKNFSVATEALKLLGEDPSIASLL